MTSLSVNVNAVAMLRNRRDLPWPSVTGLSRIALAAGAAGITVHPRPDQRHIRFSDVPELRALLDAEFPAAEFNIEGYPTPEFLDLVRTGRPDQVTLVPDDPAQATSDHGWDFIGRAAFLKPVVDRLKGEGIRVSLFADPDPTGYEQAVEIGADRLELYTGPYGATYDDSAAQNLELDRLHVLGVLSLIFWAVTIIVSVKYVIVIMRADNRGEGGSLALLALLNRVTHGKPGIAALVGMLGVFAAALFYGDSMITPAISVLSAVEGLEVAAPQLHPAVVPLTIAILDARGAQKLFTAQDGTSLMRAEIAHGKAYGALALGMGSRALFQRAQEQAYFIDSVNTLAQGRLVPVPGGVLIMDGTTLLGAVGVSGDTSDNDEICAVAGIEAAGLKANAG